MLVINGNSVSEALDTETRAYNDMLFSGFNSCIQQTSQYGYWQSYPVYVCTDKTKKAIDVLKALEADGLKVTSVTKFIALVEKIAAIL